LRPAFSGSSIRVISEDMPKVDDLIEQCHDIILARQDKQLELEEELYRELIELYRSPESLIKWTKDTAPRFKQPTHKKQKLQ